MLSRASNLIIESLCSRRGVHQYAQNDISLLRCLTWSDDSGNFRSSSMWSRISDMGKLKTNMFRVFSTGLGGERKNDSGTSHQQQELSKSNRSSEKPSGSRRDHASEDIHQILDKWGEAMEKGDWDSAWKAFESVASPEKSDLPSLEEILAVEVDHGERVMRRQREETIQQNLSNLRVRQVDSQNMSHGVGRRKTSIARVWIREGMGHMMVNRTPYDIYFPLIECRNDLITPFILTDTLGQFDVMAAVEGGGTTGQAQALRHGISKALQNWNPDLRVPLKAGGLLTRDSRVVERKKPGRKKARKAFQWVKR